MWIQTEEYIVPKIVLSRKKEEVLLMAAWNRVHGE